MSEPRYSHDLLPVTYTTDEGTQQAPVVAMLPVGSFEQHGPHLPLITDTLVAVALANVIHDALPPHLHARLLPPITIACSHEHAAFPGTVSISHTTLTAIITDIAASLAHQGIRKLLIVNGHGGNYVLSNIVQQANTGDAELRMGLFPTSYDWADARSAAGITTTSHDDMHAGELETSILLATNPDYVRDNWQQQDRTAPDRRDLLIHGMTAYTGSGVIGQPSQATPAKGLDALAQLGELGRQKIETIINTTH